MEIHAAEMRPLQLTAYAKQPHFFRKRLGSATRSAQNTCLQYQPAERPCLNASIRSPARGAFSRTGENCSSSHVAMRGGSGEFALLIDAPFSAQVCPATTESAFVGSHGLRASLVV